MRRPGSGDGSPGLGPAVGSCGALRERIARGRGWPRGAQGHVRPRVSVVALRNCLLCHPDRFANATREVVNVTLRTTLAATTKLVMPTPAKPIFPVQTGVQAQQEEQSSGMTIFFSLLVLGE